MSLFSKVPGARHTQEISQSVLLPHPGALTGAALTTAVFTGGYMVLRKGLTPVGVLHAWFLGASIYAAFGIGGFSLVCLYFIWGTLVGRWCAAQRVHLIALMSIECELAATASNAGCVPFHPATGVAPCAPHDARYGISNAVAGVAAPAYHIRWRAGRAI